MKHIKNILSILTVIFTAVSFLGAIVVYKYGLINDFLHNLTLDGEFISYDNNLLTLDYEFISYDKNLFLDYQNEYNIIVELLKNNYQQAKQQSDISFRIYFPTCRDGKMICFSEVDEKQEIVLTDKELNAMNIINQTFRLDKRSLTSMTAYDNFVAFEVESSRAAFIYSENDTKPDFVSSPKQKKRSVCVEKITDHWYYVCR